MDVTLEGAATTPAITLCFWWAEESAEAQVDESIMDESMLEMDPNNWICKFCSIVAILIPLCIFS